MKSCFGAILIAILALIVSHEVKLGKDLVMKSREKNMPPPPEDGQIMDVDYNDEPPRGRNLFTASKCDGLAEDDCHSNSCSWCKSGAVPPSCKDPEMAKKLPPAVFQCDNIGFQQFLDSKCDGKAEDDCHSDSTCSWCKSGAVPPSCKAKEMAKKLPPAVFQCDNLDAPSNKCEGLSEDSCHDDKTCSWCISAAVKPACKNQADAKKLPSAIFKCDNIG